MSYFCVKVVTFYSLVSGVVFILSGENVGDFLYGTKLLANDISTLDLDFVEKVGVNSETPDDEVSIDSLSDTLPDIDVDVNPKTEDLTETTDSGPAVKVSEQDSSGASVGSGKPSSTVSPKIKQNSGSVVTKNISSNVNKPTPVQPVKVIEVTVKPKRGSTCTADNKTTTTYKTSYIGPRYGGGRWVVDTRNFYSTHPWYGEQLDEFHTTVERDTNCKVTVKLYLKNSKDTQKWQWYRKSDWRWWKQKTHYSDTEFAKDLSARLLV